MNRLKALLLTTALVAGSSALASAQAYHEDGVGVQLRIGINEGHGYHGRPPVYGYRNDDRDRDRDDRDYLRVDRDDYRRVDRDDYRRGDRDDRWRRDWDHDG